ncbi:MAG TPA: hypothetical protein VN513_11270 [Gemmatimonadales bacterium]|nr:hypothetical protein [Gemmatimonadales bacterium]
MSIHSAAVGTSGESGTPAVEYRPWRPAVWVLIIVAALVAGSAGGGALTLFWSRGPLAPYQYHLWRWEADTVVGTAFARIGIAHSPDDASGERAIRQYFKLTSEIAAANNTATPNLNLIDTLTNERANYQHDVEATLERWIDQSVAAEGLQRELPLFNDVSLTWPPVAFDLTSPPQILVRSPRDRIQRLNDTLLKNGLSLRDIENIEQQADTNQIVSIVVPLGGIAAYPAIVDNDEDYDSLLNTAAHEWTHHYLAFYPLGQIFYSSSDGETLNETTANIVGQHLGDLVRKAHPITLPAGQDGSAPAGPPPTVDFNTEMHNLRLKVDALLAQGKIAEAEKAMDDERVYLDQHGITIREINQAYFAFYGTYGNTAESSNPIGPKVEEVWSLTQDVGKFLRAMREVTSVADLDRTIAALQATQ